ncbi:MBL fold metallo-hydrolase [Psychroserpens luteus]|uniref:MBL fold metallo-hydrolase n=1 Tax=Psychroserpens luteus TaxID=1434066 RepID=A0ABW5ZMH5_9FLAO|nr:MBL fold metallo-hydrolase [Psychroserpens luteus]
MINVRMYQANEGDAFLISFGIDKNINVIIDMGLSDTYKNHIKKDLILLNEKAKSIQLLVVTHIDKDHIEGAISFLKENGNNSNIIKVEEVWHNSFKHLQFNKRKVDKIQKEESKALTLIKHQNSNNSKQDGLCDTSIEEGVTLASLIYENKYKWNHMFNNKAICFEEKINNTIESVKFILLSPDHKKLKKLSKKWEDKLDSIFYNFKISDDVIFDDAFELYMQNLNDTELELKDTSSSSDVFDIDKLALKEENEYTETNGSSISFIIEYKEKKMLFLADSQINIIYKNINKLKASGYHLNFDLVKISHHGSNKNTSNKLLSLFDSKRYLISTDGKKHSHPNLEVIAKIIKKESIHTKELIFNYEHPKLKPFQSSSLKEKYNYEIIVQNEITIN